MCRSSCLIITVSAILLSSYVLTAKEPAPVFNDISSADTGGKNDTSEYKPLDGNHPGILKFRQLITGATHNRPDFYPGAGDFIGWPGGIDRMPNGDLVMSFSSGYWHVSFAEPRSIEPQVRKRWEEDGWPLEFSAPTGGRSMICRSTDGGKTWSKPQTILDHRLDDGGHAIFTCEDKSILCMIGVQASWYGYQKAPEKFKNDIDGLNTKQFVVRSTDSGKTWSEPIGLECPGSFYERSHGNRPIQLSGGAILWPTYFMNSGDQYLQGAVRRSDDSGKSWKVISIIKRKGNSIDEPAIAELKSGQLILVTRPDGAVFHSDDQGLNWKDTGSRIVPNGKFKAPQLIVLKDGTVVAVATWSNLRVWISRDEGLTWTRDIPLDTSCYGYPGSFLFEEDESILLPYCASGRAPNQIYLVRFQINQKRNGIEILPVSH